MSIFSVLCILYGISVLTVFSFPPIETPSTVPETQQELSKLLCNAHNLDQLPFSQGATTLIYTSSLHRFAAGEVMVEPCSCLVWRGATDCWYK